MSETAEATAAFHAPAQAAAIPLDLHPGDRDVAFAALVDRHSRFLFRVAMAQLKNPQDAEDAVQETLLKLYRGDAWLQMRDERAFLARAVWHAGLDRLSTAATRAMRHAEDVTTLDLASPANTPEQDALGASDRDRMARLIQSLPELFRQPLVLSAIDGMKSHEVAALLGIPEGTVRTRVMRAKAELRRRFLAANTLAEATQ